MSGTKVSIKYGFGKPQTGSLKKAELAIDLKDLSLWTAESDGSEPVRVGHDTTEVEQGVEDNAANIEQNRLDIEINANNIEQNKQDIEANADSIANNKLDIETNAANIEQNKQNIETNANNIANNKLEIDANAAQIEINRQDIADIIVDVDANLVQIDKNTADIITNKDNISTLDADAVKKSVATLQQIVGAIKAASFEGDGSKLSGITTDQLADVNSAGANKDEFLIYNGSSWIAEGFHIDTELTYQGAINLTAPMAVTPANGDLYINNTNGTVHSSWAGISGQTVREGNVVGYAETKARWFLLGDIASSSVTDVEGGSGIDVDDSKPAEPVVSIDRAEVDGWYEPKFSKLSGFNKNFGTTAGTVSEGNHSHNEFGNFEPAFAKNTAFNKNFGTANNDVARGDHSHNEFGDYEPAFPKNTAFNKNFGTTSGTVSQGNHTHSNYLQDAPSNANQYARQGGAWTIVQATGGGTDNLQDVTNRGATTTKGITAALFTTAGVVTSSRNAINNAGAARIDLNDTSHATGKKYIRSNGGAFDVVRHDYGKAIFTVKDNGDSIISGALDVATKVKAKAFHASAGSEEHYFYGSNPNTTAVNGSTGRSVKINFTASNYERLYFQDWACVLKIAGSFSGPEMHSAVHACITWNSQDLKANPKGNVKSLTKLAAGEVRGTYNTDVNVFVGAPCVPTSSTNSGTGRAIGFCSSNGDSGSAKTFSAMRKSTSNGSIEGSGNMTCGMSINEAARQTYSLDTDMEFEEKKAREIDRLMTRAANTEWYDADEEGMANSPITWALPNLKTGGVFLTRSMVADQDSEEFYPEHTLIKFAEWPDEDCLFDAWELNGKRLVVNLDKAKQQVIEMLKHQARFYIPRASCLQGMFGQDDELQELKDLILGFKSRAESKSVTTMQLNEIMQKIRQEEREDFAFLKF